MEKYIFTGIIVTAFLCTVKTEDANMLLENLVVGPIAANCYILGDKTSKEGAVVDPGDDAGQILHAVKKSGFVIKYIIITHGHFDHIGAMAELKKQLNADFLMHKSDLPFVQRSKSSALNWGITIEQVPDPDRYVEDGDILKLGSLELKILHTPGHSPGGLCIYIEKENILLSGDTLFRFSVGRTDFDGGSMKELVKSIKQKLFTLPDSTIVYSGHGEPTTIGDEKAQNMFVR